MRMEAPGTKRIKIFRVTSHWYSSGVSAPMAMDRVWRRVVSQSSSQTVTLQATAVTALVINKLAVKVLCSSRKGKLTHKTPMPR